MLNDGRCKTTEKKDKIDDQHTGIGMRNSYTVLAEDFAVTIIANVRQ